MNPVKNPRKQKYQWIHIIRLAHLWLYITC